MAYYTIMAMPIRALELHYPMIQLLIIAISIYTLSDLGDSSKLIGSLFRTVTLCSPR